MYFGFIYFIILLARLHEGNLKVLKQTGMKSTWTKRYVILTATSFSYYSKPDVFIHFLISLSDIYYYYNNNNNNINKNKNNR